MKNLESVKTNQIETIEGVTVKNFMPILYKNWFDVYYNDQRIAIINGMVSPLQWTAKNGSDIPIQIISNIENYCSANIID